jgi:hypothetical protein
MNEDIFIFDIKSGSSICPVDTKRVRPKPRPSHYSKQYGFPTELLSVTSKTAKTKTSD